MIARVSQYRNFGDGGSNVKEEGREGGKSPCKLQNGILSSWIVGKSDGGGGGDKR